MNHADEMAAKPDAAGSGEKPDQQLRAILENLQRVNPVEEDDLHSGIAHRETSERRAIYSRLVAIENEMKRRGSRGFARYLVAILIGVAATLAWQSYGDAAKQLIATNAPELGWSPEAKVVPKAPTAASLDPENVQQMARDLATLRQTVEQLAASQDQMAREIAKLEVADVEILAKITPMPPPPRPIAAPARKPASSPAPVTPSTSRGIPPPHP